VHTQASYNPAYAVYQFFGLSDGNVANVVIGEKIKAHLTPESCKTVKDWRRRQAREARAKKRTSRGKKLQKPRPRVSLHAVENSRSPRLYRRAFSLAAVGSAYKTAHSDFARTPRLLTADQFSERLACVLAAGVQLRVSTVAVSKIRSVLLSQRPDESVAALLPYLAVIVATAATTSLGLLLVTGALEFSMI
jgi:hypothetical protein